MLCSQNTKEKKHTQAPNEFLVKGLNFGLFFGGNNCAATIESRRTTLSSQQSFISFKVIVLSRLVVYATNNNTPYTIEKKAKNLEQSNQHKAFYIASYRMAYKFTLFCLNTLLRIYTTRICCRHSSGLFCQI